MTEIVGAVQKHGDRALLRYTEMFDRLRLTPATMEVKPAEIERALAKRGAQGFGYPTTRGKTDCGCFTAANCKKAGSIAIRSGCYLASESRRWNASAFMFPAAKRPILRLF